MRGLNISFFLFFTVSSLFSQNTIDKSNSYSYAKSSAYARGIATIENKVFVGSSDGSIYHTTPKLERSSKIFHLEDVNEIRDLALYDNQVLAMHSGNNGLLIKIDFNGTYKLIYQKDWEGVFLDGFDFIGAKGFMMGDPTEGSFNLFHTNDFGDTWNRCEGSIKAKNGEAGYAASGTNVQMLNENTFVFVSGGSISRFFKSTNKGRTWLTVDLPYYPGKSSGAYSICFANDKNGVIVGGDFLSPNTKLNTVFYTNDGGETWYNSKKSVNGYRSCVYYVKGVFYACGTNGIDYSSDKGVTWTPLASGNFFSLNSIEDKLIATTKNGTVSLFNLINK